VTPEDALERAEQAGIHTLRIPTPFMVGRVNCYLIEDEPLTLVDTGPNSGKALDDLEHQLADRERSIEDLELVILTHQHIDHIGLAEIVASRSGAEVAAIGASASFLENFGEDAERDDQFAAGLMLSHGVPEDVVTALQSVSRSFRAWGSRPKVTRPLRDGELLRFADRSLEVQHRPGHSPSDTLLWDADRRLLFAADHLIAHISSNALITRPLDGSSEREAAQGEGAAGKPDSGPSAKPHRSQRTQALVTYIESMRRTRELPAEIVLPGHGEPITDHVALIDERFEQYRRRAGKIYELVAERPRTGYELAQALWGNVAVTQAFLTLSEVIGHLDLLVNAGRVREVDNGVIRFETTGGGEPGEDLLADAGAGNPASSRG
jgi:glyoxylase-like metal-dependent hydrolase (beta-lactamase superfamily II)